MNSLIGKITRNISALTGAIFGAARNVDYKTLSNYILAINQVKDMDEILLEVSKCLKDILNYRLFAFAVQDGDQLKVWIDPSLYKKPIRKIIEKDFNYTGRFKIRYLTEDTGQRNDMVSFRSSDLMSYVLLDDKYLGKLYVLPDRKMFRYHTEIMNVIIKSLGIALSNVMNIMRLESDAAFDSLTDCYNRREFDRLLEQQVANAQRHGRDISVVMFDLDHFKKINDTYGHQAGDEVLRAVAKEVRRNIRKGDVLARYGGEEFVLALPDARQARALELAERVRSAVEGMVVKVTDGHEIRLTASFGVAWLKGNPDRHSLVREADLMLYQAKANGRNRVMPGLKLCPSEGCHSAGPTLINHPSSFGNT